MLVNDVQKLMSNPEVRYRAEEKLSPDTLDGVRIQLEGLPGTHVVQISAFSVSPSLSQKAAIAVSVVLMEQIQAITNAERVSVAERAELPVEPVAPKRVVKILLTFAASFIFFSLLWIMLAPKRCRLNAADVETGGYSIQVLGSVTDCRKDLQMFTKKERKLHGAVSQHVNRFTVKDVQALSMILRKPPNEALRSVVFASRLSDEGKSALAVLMAIELCEQGKRVLVVDMDCYTPTVGRLVRAQGGMDLHHYFRGEATLDQIILSTSTPNLFIIDNLQSQASAIQMVTTPLFGAWMEQMYREFDYILFDTPPIGLYTDAAAIGSVLDGTILVMAQERSTDDELREALRKLRQADGSLIGIVLTFKKPQKSRQYRDVDDYPAKLM